MPFELPGSAALARRVVETLGPDRAVLLQNHGCFCVGKDIGAAMTAAVYVEEAAQIACYARLLGTFRPLSEQNIADFKAIIASNQAV